MSWLMRRAVLTKAKEKDIPRDVAVDVDLASVQQSVDQILTSDWYAATRDNPELVETIMIAIAVKEIIAFFTFIFMLF